MTPPSPRRGDDSGSRVDPLYVIFEQHLYNFQDSEADRKTFVQNVVGEYLRHLRKLKIVVPRSLESSIVEELASIVNTMLVKKIYGFLTIEDYKKTAEPAVRKRAKSRYAKLGSRAAR
jgi:hypothetical protein